MRSAPPPPLHQPGSLQSLLDPRVAQLDRVLFLQLLVEVPRAQIKVAFLIQPQHLFTSFHWDTALALFSLPSIRQPVVAFLLQPFPPAPHCPVTHPNDLRRLPPAYLL